MRFFTTAIENFVVLCGGLPPKHKRPSALFEDLKYAEGEVLFSSARLALWFDDIDRRLRRAKGSATRIRQVDGKRLNIPHNEGSITVEAIFLQTDGKEYMAVCKHRGKECNYSIPELRSFVRMFSTSSRGKRTRRRAFLGIPTSDN